MPIVAVDGFLDATPVSITTYATVPIPGTTFQAIGAPAAQVSNFTVNRNGDWLECDSTANTSGSLATKVGAVFRPLADIITFTATTYAYGAVRFKKRSAYEAQPYPLIGFGNSSGPASTVTALDCRDLPGGGEVGREYFFEWAIDIASWTIKRRLDGAVLSDVAIPSTQQAAFLAQNKAIVFGLASVNVLQRYNTGIDVRDIYYGERLEGETTTWVGLVSLVPLPVTEFPAPWTGNDGAGGSMTPLAAVNTPVTTLASLSAPYAVSDINRTEVNVKVDNSAVSGLIHGVFASTVAKRQDNAVGRVSEVLDVGGATIATMTPFLSTAMAHYPLKFMAKAPDGQPWTKEKIAAMTVKLSVQ